MSKDTKVKFSWINSLLSAIVITVFMLVLNDVNKYGTISKTRNIFLAVNIGVAIVSLVLLFLTVKANNSNNKTFKFGFTGLLIICLAVGGYGYYLLNIVNSNIKDITQQDKVIEYHSSFVVKNNTFKDVEDLKDKTIGIIASDKFIEGHTLPVDELDKLEYDKVVQKEYASYPLLINALVKDEVDFIALPKDFETLFVTDEHIEPELSKISAVYSFSGKYDNPSIISGSDVDVTSVPFTMLIMGNDGGRTDSLMVASVNPTSMQITLTSIARDSYVPIMCYPNQNRDKINHARTISRECTIDTVENLLDIKIDFFVEVSFMGLVDLVDALGTIPIESPGYFCGNIERPEGGGVCIQEGYNDLNGDQVLAFVRERKSFEGGDFQRQMNQQQAIGSLITTVAETRNIDTLLNLVKATGKNVDTNLSVTQLIDLMNMALQRMESTHLDPANLVTIYGNRITGQGVMNYSPEYGFDLYYYVLYDGSIQDAKDLIAMNMRSDGILEIPKGFNYSVQDEYTPPKFGKDEYYESVDQGIFKNTGVKPKDDEEETDNTGEVTLKELYGKSRAEADSYLKGLGFSYNDAGTEVVKTTDKSLDGIEIVASYTAGVKLDQEHSVVNLKFIKYVYEPEIPDPVEPEDPDKENPTNPENPDEDKPTNPEEGGSEGGNGTEGGTGGNVKPKP